MSKPSAQAIVMQDYGAPQVLMPESRDIPDAAPGEVVIEATACPINRADLEIRSGAWPIGGDSPFPYVPGLETCGRVLKVGAGVDLAPGTAVITMMQRLGGIHGIRDGGYQSHPKVPANTLAVVPEGTDLWSLAALGLAAVTAYHGIERLQLKPGQRVVIQGASGGVGSVALKLAKQVGAYTIAASYGDRHIPALEAAGADEVWNTKQKPLTDWADEKVDAVFEMIGGQTFADSAAILKRGGRLCTIGAVTGGEAHFSVWDLLNELVFTGWTSENLTQQGLQAAINTISSMLNRGDLEPPQVATYALSEASQAHQALEDGTVFGRILLRPSV